MKRIRVSAIDGVAKKAALGAMLFSSVVMFATTPNRNTRTENPPQAEVVSREGADALKAITFPGFQQNPTVPTVHNKKLDENLLKLTDPEYIQDTKDYLDTEYNTSGTYLGSAYIQQAIDYNMFLEFLNGNIEILKRFDEEAYNKIDKGAMEQVVAKSGPIIEWLNKYYFSVYNKPFQFDHPPDYKELHDALDNYIEKDPDELFKNSLLIFRSDNRDFSNKINNTNMSLVLKNSNLSAYEMNNADYLLFLNLLKKVGIYTGYKDRDILEIYSIFMNIVKPQAE